MEEEEAVTICHVEGCGSAAVATHHRGGGLLEPAVPVCRVHLAQAVDRALEDVDARRDEPEPPGSLTGVVEPL